MIPLALLLGGALFTGLYVAGYGGAMAGLAIVLLAWHIGGQLVEWSQQIHDRRVALRRWRAWR